MVLRDLQRGVTDTFGKSFGFEIKVGEKTGASEVLENSLAAQLVMAIYLREPWAAVRKVRLFDQDYRRIFNRSITPYKLRLLFLLDRAIQSVRDDFRDELQSSFASIKFTLAHLVAEVVRQSEAGHQLLEIPERWLKNAEEPVYEALVQIAGEVTDLINFHVEQESELDENYDSKVAFKSRSGVLRLQGEVLRDAKRQAARDARKQTTGNSYLFSVSPAP
ncbi:hypothetical protein AD006_30300 (plasmid) [Pseudonocardia sp. EC080610-09]|nr:hypothetical protein AD006_30300 [Pseudonocardia sp. EC080610-09]ALL85524.1 hypothetical protein AD017_30950 [Pseudonocardia sp. EC080619-01]